MARSPLSAPQTARATLRAGPFAFTARVRTTPLGLLAVGGLASAVLLSVPPIIRASGRAAGGAKRTALAPPDA